MIATVAMIGYGDLLITTKFVLSVVIMNENSPISARLHTALIQNSITSYNFDCDTQKTYLCKLTC